jgi:hypothetical protein
MQNVSKKTIYFIVSPFIFGALTWALSGSIVLGLAVMGGLLVARLVMLALWRRRMSRYRYEDERE